MNALFALCPLELCRFEFMQRALVAAALVGIAAPSIGVFLVQRRLALMGDGIGHVAFAGVAAGLLTRTSPVVTAIIAASIGAVVIEVLRSRGRTASDVALALIFYGGIAAAVLLTSLSQSTGTNLVAYLFGSPLTVDGFDLAIVAVVSVLVVTLTTALRGRLFAICYDEEVARSYGLPVGALNLLIAVTAAVTIAVTMQIVGILLVSAMLVLPVAATQQVTSSFRATVLGSVAVGGVLSVGGLVLAYYADVYPSATIVLGAIAVFMLAAILARMQVAN